MRVSGVRRSWETPASISVRWLIWRWIRSRITRKAAAACRTSVAPSSLKRVTSRPLPKASAAAANRRIGRIWLRMKMMAMANSTIAAPTIHSRKMYVVELNSRRSGDITDSTPSAICTRISIQLLATRVSITKGFRTRSSSAMPSVRSSRLFSFWRCGGRMASGSKVMIRSMVRAAMDSVSVRLAIEPSRSNCSITMPISPPTA